MRSCSKQKSWAAMLTGRSTQMYLVEDIDQARLRYEKLGFKPRPTDDTGCVGFVSNEDSVILLSRSYAERALPARAVELMWQKPALYIWVESLVDMREALHGSFLGETHVAGLREWVVELPQGVVVMAEGVPTHQGTRAVN